MCLCCVSDSLFVPQGTGPDIQRFGVVPSHLQPKDPRVRTLRFTLAMANLQYRLGCAAAQSLQQKLLLRKSKMCRLKVVLHFSSLVAYWTLWDINIENHKCKQKQMFLNPSAPFSSLVCITVSQLHALFALISLVILTATGLFSALAHSFRFFRPRSYAMMYAVILFTAFPFFKIYT